MRKHFAVLLIGSIIYVIILIGQTSGYLVASTGPGGATRENVIILIEALRALGLYIVFATLVIGHGVSSGKSPA